MDDLKLVTQLRTMLALLEAALGSVEEGIAFTDRDGVVAWTNAAFDRFVGRLHLQTLGEGLLDLLPDHDLLAHEQSFGSLPFWDGAPSGCTSWVLSLSSPRRVIHVSWAQVHLPGKLTLIFSFQARSDLAPSQSSLPESQGTLLDSQRDGTARAELRTLGLEQDRDEALAATSAKTRFLARLSHEIRTPLNAVIGMAALLSKTNLDSGQSEMVETIRCSGEHLLCLINDIQDLSKIETGQLELRPRVFDLPALIVDCHHLFRFQELQGRVALEVSVPADAPRWLRGDDLKLRQILINLLANAFKCTLDGKICLSVLVAARHGDELELLIRVTDTGIGIAADRLPFIFDEFTCYSSNLATTNQGTGLGLPLCSRLCQAMGGTISLASQLGEGSSFTVQLPFLIAEQRPPIPEASLAGEGFKGVRILVVDDNRVNQRVLELMLHRLGLHPEVVGDGAAAIERVKAGGIDLVFMDIELPRLDGMETTRRLREAGFVDLYVIALTAFSFNSFRQDCDDVGMNDFMTKPLRFEDLLAALNRFRLWRYPGVGAGRA
jgi:signal transduction histidine kinase/CheY-like chemotaxis protein